MRKNWMYEESRTLIANYKTEEVKKHGWGKYAKLLGRSEASVNAQFRRLKNKGLDTLEAFNFAFGSDTVGQMPPLDKYKVGIKRVRDISLIAMKDVYAVKFKFEPLQFVKITLYGLNYKGRIIRCIAEQGMGYLWC